MDELIKKAEEHPVHKRHRKFRQWIELALIEDKQKRMERLFELYDAQIKQDEVNDYFESQ